MIGLSSTNKKTMSSCSVLNNEIDIKNYKKRGRISQGGFGIVYKIQDKKTEEIFAAKIIDCQDNNEICNKMVDREVKIMSNINHPTIIKFIGYSKKDFQDENNVVIIMQFAQNGSLAELLKNIQDQTCPPDVDNTIRQIIIIGIARGMKYLHDRNIIHRDLKPENILLDDQYYPLITDFGLSKKFETGHSYSQTMACGTLMYKAPEVLRNERYNIKADVYSFAILMYQVVTDLFPYPELASKKMSDFDFQNNIMNKEYRPEFKYPVNECLKNLIQECWSNDSMQRPTFTEIFDRLCQDDYFLDGVDNQQLRLYIEDINEVKDSIDKMQMKIEEYKKKIKKLIKDQKDLEDDRDKYKNEKNSLKKKYKKIKNENEKLKSDLTESKEKIENIAEENEKLKSDLIKSKEKIENIAEENEKLKSDLIKSKEKIENIAEENEKLKSDLTESREKSDSIYKENEKLKSDLTESKEKIENIAEENEKLKSDLIKSKEKIENIAEENEKLKSDLTKSKEKIENIAEENEKLKSDLTESKEKSKKIAEKNEELKSNLGELDDRFEYVKEILTLFSEALQKENLILDVNDFAVGECIRYKYYRESYDENLRKIAPDFYDIYRAIRKESKGQPKLECSKSVIYYSKEPSNLRLFSSKILNQSSISHITILPIIGYSIEKECYAVYIPFMKNGSLDYLLEKASKGMPDGVSPDWYTFISTCIFGVACGMAYLHQNHIYHLNLKASNILIDDDFHPRISGFSQSIKVSGYREKQNCTFGCPANRAPDCLDKNYGFITNKVDVYSYGMLLYHIWVCEPWYYNNEKGKFDSRWKIEKSILEGKRPTIPDRYISDKKCELINHCWMQNPEERPSFIDIVELFMQSKKDFFDYDLIDEVIFEDYIDEAIKDLDFTGQEKDESD